MSTFGTCHKNRYIGTTFWSTTSNPIQQVPRSLNFTKEEEKITHLQKELLFGKNLASIKIHCAFMFDLE
jgi:hypothetical protein